MFPRILHIYGPLWVNGYGLMIALGFLVFTLATYFDGWRLKNIRAEQFFNVLFVGFLSAVFGGRMLFVLFNPPTTIDHFFEIFYPWVGGFSQFGSIISVIVGVTWYLKRIGVQVLSFFDLIAFYVPVLMAISRFGCFFAGCCYGALTHAHTWYSVVFADPNGLAPLYVSLYATQLFAVVSNVFMLVVLILIRKTIHHVPGTIVFSYLMLASLSRFTIDFWRGDRGVGLITSMQLVVAGVFIVACVALFKIRRSKHVDF